MARFEFVRRGDVTVVYWKDDGRRAGEIRDGQLSADLADFAVRRGLDAAYCGLPDNSRQRELNACTCDNDAAVYGSRALCLCVVLDEQCECECECCDDDVRADLRALRRPR